VLAWSALEAMGTLLDSLAPEQAAVTLLDGLRLREPLADALATVGVDSDEKWRVAARLRASFAHAPGISAPHSWVHDPDVAWVIGVHQHDARSYLVKEHFERFLWWMVFRDFLRIAGQEQPDLEEIDRLAKEIGTRMDAVANAGYLVEVLEEPVTRSQLPLHE
jgi:hypothetical protein